MHGAGYAVLCLRSRMWPETQRCGDIAAMGDVSSDTLPLPHSLAGLR